ncbi:hypothetical protein [Pseudokineococcus marinus]|uniref:Uncharacterized protein n=1 Tax=Pseudokineococcus marinus TaxID=351215 RepID=A0A849BQ94_9ACTN|nr:hypothetical protein [Pseudokineococcus marinus]NNH22704.1 hypothetical protein [Pseudokineococcus marinus]
MSVIEPIAAKGHTTGRATRATSRATPSTASALPATPTMSGGAPECGASTASHHHDVVGVVP